MLRLCIMKHYRMLKGYTAGLTTSNIAFKELSPQIDVSYGVVGGDWAVGGA